MRTKALMTAAVGAGVLGLLAPTAMAGPDGPTRVWLCHFEDHEATNVSEDRNGSDPGFFTTPEGLHLDGDYVVRYNTPEEATDPEGRAGLNAGQQRLCEVDAGGEFILVSPNAVGDENDVRGHRAQNLSRVDTYPDGWNG